MFNRRCVARIVLVVVVVLGISRFKGVDSRPLWGRMPLGPPYIPLSQVLPGGKGVTYLSDLTQNFGDDMSHQISLGGKLVSAVGNAIQNHEDLSSKEVDDISHIVDSNYRSDYNEEGDDDDQGEYRDDYEEP
ncbi:uncharacterized protein LOC110234116 [Exaiptasia diaphana]|uniref:Uncharacterized protein n=1 Tax=Exaiptasia diaphana TaxID=2652724 RepID=A0A913WWK7_EXADI|nr:uncharacterized protein LOC110234116 [Exaiptasia diaphana]KXJ17363.1 hypothetical protein AC249_AIPGENE23789 [Exaiptasia diaphana]